VRRYNLCVIGAGPAGLSAAIEAAKTGMSVGVFDENQKAGGQLFKQIHKFFGSREHKASIRGFNIGYELLTEAKALGVDVHLDSVVIGIYDPLRITVCEDGCITNYAADNIVVATGASENTVPFEGWDLPGVLGAGAAQTMMNLHGVQPGEKIIMLGSGNVGLVVGFQLLQAGCKVEAVVDALPHVGGYGVHASKLARTGVPFYLSHSIVRAEGEDHVTGVVIAQVDSHFNFLPGTEKHFDADTVCLAVGLNPMSQLTRMAGCEMVNKGGLVPKTDKYGATTIDGLFAAGDVAGIEEASSAMITGRIAALSAAKRSGFIDEKQFEDGYNENHSSILKLRKGMFAPENRGRMDITKTDEGYPLSVSLLENGFVSDTEIRTFPGVISEEGVHPVIECTQNIPCDPCQEACRVGCIKIGEGITSLPQVNADKKCVNCGRCVAVCPGQAIFLVDEETENGFGTVTMPYEFLPLPQKGDIGVGLDRAGKAVCTAEVTDVKSRKEFDHTNLLTVKVPSEMVMKVRFYKGKEAAKHE